ncbi:MAG: hypothetical protein AB1374_05925 [Bacillota bacterium]
MTQTYPEMNAKITDMLRRDGSEYALYAAARIEELEGQVKDLRDTLDEVRRWLSACSGDILEYISERLKGKTG